MFYFGLDLGQLSDPSAGVILEAHGEGEARIYACRYIVQYPLGTSYPMMVSAVGFLLDQPPLVGDCPLIIDSTGVGVAVADMFAEAGRPYLGLTITGGVGWHWARPNQLHVAKIQLVSVVQKFLQSGRLRMGAGLPHARTLQQELRDFRVKISKAANEVYDAREGAHDDLVLSLAITLFAAEAGAACRTPPPPLVITGRRPYGAGESWPPRAS